MKKLLPLIVLLGGCASDGPIVDMKGVNRAQYEQDLAECQQYAQQVRPGRDAAKGGAVGAVVGGAIGAAIGDSDTAKRGAGAGAVSGVVRGAGRGERRREQVVFRCLAGRGYRVLG